MATLNYIKFDTNKGSSKIRDFILIFMELYYITNKLHNVTSTDNKPAFSI